MPSATDKERDHPVAEAMRLISKSWTDVLKENANLRATNRSLLKTIADLRRELDQYKPVTDHVDAMARAIERGD